jgi:hypothetical protein
MNERDALELQRGSRVHDAGRGCEATVLRVHMNMISLLYDKANNCEIIRVHPAEMGEFQPILPVSAAPPAPAR